MANNNVNNKDNALCSQVVEILKGEGFNLFKDKKSGKWISLYCNARAWGNLTGYKEEVNRETGEFIKCKQNSLPRLPYSYQLALHNLIHKAYIRCDTGQVVFTRKGIELEGIEKELALRGFKDFIGVKKTLQNHIYLLRKKYDPMFDPIRDAYKDDDDDDAKVTVVDDGAAE